MTRILIVDDQFGDGNRVSKAISDNPDCRISLINDAASALERIRNRPPELILLGSLSDRIDSLKLLMDIKREHPKIPVLAYAIKSLDAMDLLRETITELLCESRSSKSKQQHRKRNH